MKELKKRIEKRKLIQWARGNHSILSFFWLLKKKKIHPNQQLYAQVSFPSTTTNTAFLPKGRTSDCNLEIISQVYKVGQQQHYGKTIPCGEETRNGQHPRGVLSWIEAERPHSPGERLSQPQTGHFCLFSNRRFPKLDQTENCPLEALLPL